MGSKKLEEFLTKNISKANVAKDEEKKIDWENEKFKWLQAIKEFYSNVEEWLKPFVDRDQLEIKYNDIHLEEENIGKYDTKSMCIYILNEKVVLEPIGTMLIGAHGRIDMKGKNGVAKFLLVKEKSEGFKFTVTIGNEALLKEDNEDDIEQKLVWKFATPSPDIKFTLLDGELFSDILLEIIK